VIAPRNIDELHEHVGEEIGASGWRPVTQGDLNRFGEATGDRQWIRTDVERAAKGPFKGIIVHD
jgi:acyl dehydratase